MKCLLGIFFILGCMTNAYAEVCEYSVPETKVLIYRKGEYLPVYFSRFQLDLPGVPSAFLAGDGFTAAYPERGYVGIQHLAPSMMGDSLSNLAPDLTSVSDYYRLIYRLPSHLAGMASHKALSLQRQLLNLDCKTDVVIFQINDIQVVFDGARDATGFHKIMLLDGGDVQLITMRGSREAAIRLMSSIKRRL